MIMLFVLPALLLLALLAFTRPRTAVILLTALLPAYLLRFTAFGLPTNFLEAAIAVVFFFSFLRPSNRRAWPQAWRTVPLFLRWLIALFVLSAIISTTISPHPLTSLGILKSWIIIPLLLGWLVLSHSHVISTPVARREGSPLSGNPRSPAAGGGSEPEARGERVPSVTGPANITPILRSLVLSGAAVALLGLTQINRLDRVRSVFDVPNSLALFLVPLLIISLWLSFARHHRLFFLPASVILAAAIIATQSAAGLAAAVITLIIGLLLFRPARRSYATQTIHRRWLVVILLIIASLAYLFSTGRLAYLARPIFQPDTPNSLSVRWQLWSISLDLIKDHPLLGAGLGAFEPAYQAKLHDRFKTYANCAVTTKPCPQPLPEFVFRDPHNWPLSFWLNTGLLGLASFTLINLYVLLQVWHATLKPTKGFTHRSYQHYLTQAPALALISILIFGLADTVYWKNDLSAQYWTILALLIALLHNQPNRLTNY